MQDNNKTKSTDFLPGKPSMDSMSRSSNPAVATTTSTVSARSLENASAHVIDLKNNPTSFADSPLLQQSPPEAKEVLATDVKQSINKKDTDPTSVAVGSPSTDEPTTHKPDGFSSIEVEPTQGSTPAMSEPADNQSSSMAPDSTTTEPEKKLDELNLADSTATTPDKNIEKPKKSGKLKWILITVAIVLVVAIGAGVTIFIMQSTGSTV